MADTETPEQIMAYFEQLNALESEFEDVEEKISKPIGLQELFESI